MSDMKKLSLTQQRFAVFQEVYLASNTAFPNTFAVIDLHRSKQILMSSLMHFLSWQARDETTLQTFRTLRRLIANLGRLSVADNVALTQVDVYSCIAQNEIDQRKLDLSSMNWSTLYRPSRFSTPIDVNITYFRESQSN
jgi:hypothetical protein